MEKERIIHINEFDISKMHPTTKEALDPNAKRGVKIAVIGKPGMGKSTLIKGLIYGKKHIFPIAQVYSGTEDSNQDYQKNFPSLFVFNGLNDEALLSGIKRQKMAKKYLDYPWGIYLQDDCTDNPAALHAPIYQSIFKNGRHWKMWFILSLQYCMDIKPVIRNNLDYTFILKETNIENRKRLWKNYANCIDDFSDFCELLDQITGDYTALVIDNTTQSNKLEDCVFYYKADLTPPNWKFGADDYWLFHNTRYNPKYIDPILS